jgi:hypothetical protein
MDFLKKHYEKILLGVMLVSLIGVLIFMLFFIADDKRQMAEKSSNLTNPRPKELANLDMSVLEDAANHLKVPYELDLERTNKLLNPLEWQRALDGSLILKNKTGLQMAEVTNITPLYTIVSLDAVITNDLGARYALRIERQAAAKPMQRRAIPYFVTSVDRTVKDVFVLQEIKGPVENPEGLVLKLADTGEVVTISKRKPFRRPDGYMADFRYPPEYRDKVFHLRNGDKVSFGGTDYIVVDVNPTELILQDQSNQKKTSLPFTP